MYNETNPLQLLIHAVCKSSSCSDGFSLISCLNKNNPLSPIYPCVIETHQSFNPEIIPGMLHLEIIVRQDGRFQPQGCPRRRFRWVSDLNVPPWARCPHTVPGGTSGLTEIMNLKINKYCRCRCRWPVAGGRWPRGLRLRPVCQRPACTRVSRPLTWADKHMYAVAYRGGAGFRQPPPRNSEGPPKSCQTQTDCENC